MYLALSIKYINHNHLLTNKVELNLFPPPPPPHTPGSANGLVRIFKLWLCLFCPWRVYQAPHVSCCAYFPISTKCMLALGILWCSSIAHKPAQVWMSLATEFSIKLNVFSIINQIHKEFNLKLRSCCCIFTFFKDFGEITWGTDLWGCW